MVPATAPNTPAQREASVLRLSNAEAASLDGGRSARNELAAAEIEFDNFFGAYRDWANQPDVALGDKTKINNLGLDVSTGEAQRAGMPATPVMRELSNIGTGRVTADCPSVEFATNYQLLCGLRRN